MLIPSLLESAVLVAVAVLAGATAAVSGFGIGSLLTPLIALRVGMPVAVAAVALPHALATAIRCWRLRDAINVEVLRRFGIVSAGGALSGLFGGLAGNQGGVRSAAMLGFDLEARAFVATATATGLMVDAARTPVYLWHSGGELLSLGIPVLLASAGVVAGTLGGERLLGGLSVATFRRLVGTIILLVGAGLLIQY